MLKSILISLDKLKFDREAYKPRAQELVSVLKPNCYQVMIDIFGMKEDNEYFHELAQTKFKEEKIRDVVFISSLFPSVLDLMEESCGNK